MGHEKLL
jgi:hypothetical protein